VRIQPERDRQTTVPLHHDTAAILEIVSPHRGDAAVNGRCESQSTANGATMKELMYEVRVAGVVPDTHLRDMQAVKLGAQQVNTVLYGLADEAALYGLIGRLRNLGLEVVEVRRVLATGDCSDDDVHGQS
jgi:hypothetical protein